MNRLKDTYKHMAAVASALLLALSVLPACSDDEGGGPGEEEGKLYTVTLSLNPSARGATTTKATPYWETDDNPKLEKYERYIDNCVVAIFQNGSWVKCLSYNITDVIADITINNDNPTTSTDGSATEVGTASVELPAGTYIFFAFANLTSLDLGNSTAGTDLIKELVTGKKTDGSAVTMDYLNEKAINLGNKKEDISRFNPDATDDITYIPMSSYGEVKEVNSDGEMDITLYRMIGKVTISIDNQTTGDLKLAGFSMGQFRRGDIYLIPYGSTANLIGSTTSGMTLNQLTQNQQDSYNPRVPTTATTPTYPEREITFEEAVTIPQNTTNTPYVYTFYEFETDVEAQKTDDHMWLSTKIEGRDNEPRGLQDFSFMRRNDWLNIPVQILETDLETTITGSRMPIGGTPKTITYPAAEAFIPILYHQIDYPGKITISFTFSLEESDGFGDVNFEFAPPQHEAGIQYTEAQLVENNNGLLYDEEKQAALDVPSKIAITETSNEGASATATMTLTTQELAYEGTAQIDLMLAVSYTKNGTSGRITVPYTIKLTNGKTEKGGN